MLYAQFWNQLSTSSKVSAYKKKCAVCMTRHTRRNRSCMSKKCCRSAQVSITKEVPHHVINA
eukprot:jgi/Botrbrau1/16543/Bobra.0256s0002.1